MYTHLFRLLFQRNHRHLGVSILDAIFAGTIESLFSCLSNSISFFPNQTNLAIESHRVPRVSISGSLTALFSYEVKSPERAAVCA